MTTELRGQSSGTHCDNTWPANDDATGRAKRACNECAADDDAGIDMIAGSRKGLLAHRLMRP